MSDKFYDTDVEWHPQLALTVIKLTDLPYVKYSLVLKPLLANH